MDGGTALLYSLPLRIILLWPIRAVVSYAAFLRAVS
jgi:hypothetical protein